MSLEQKSIQNTYILLQISCIERRKNTENRKRPDKAWERNLIQQNYEKFKLRYG